VLSYLGITTEKDNIDEIVLQYKNSGAMGLCTTIDLKNCDLSIMQDKEAIRTYVSTLLKLIDMQAVGELQIQRFGEGNLFGYSFSQFVMTSLLSGHFIEHTRSIYLDIFSCKEYDPKKVVKFSAMTFKGVTTQVNITIRP
jgi:S-adenosylmethionine/arginine decarboxylase-like enzyme